MQKAGSSAASDVKEQLAVVSRDDGSDLTTHVGEWAKARAELVQASR
jgi:hypothetical protein